MPERDTCYLCGSVSVSLVEANPGYSFLRCSHCGFRRQHPAPERQEFELLYDDEFYDERGLDAALDQQPALVRAQIERRAGTLTSLHGGPGRALDVGAGTGLFLEAARRQGWQVMGIEASPASIRIARRVAPNVVITLGDLDALPQSATFDAITMWDVLEHLPDPRRVLLQLREHLRPDGWLGISLPSVDSLRSHILGSRWRYYRSEFGHVSHFSPSTLRCLLEQSGFETVAMKSRGGLNIGRVVGADPNSVYERPASRAIQRGVDAAIERLGLGETIEAFFKRGRK